MNIKRTAVYATGYSPAIALDSLVNGTSSEYEETIVVPYGEKKDGAWTTPITLTVKKDSENTTLTYEGPDFTEEIIHLLLARGLKDSHFFLLLTIPLPDDFSRGDPRLAVVVRSEKDFRLLNEFTTFTERLPDKDNCFPYIFGVEQEELYGRHFIGDMTVQEALEYFSALTNFLKETKEQIENEKTDH